MLRRDVNEASHLCGGMPAFDVTAERTPKSGKIPTCRALPADDEPIVLDL